MSGRGRMTITKRQKERAREERRKEKADRAARRKLEKSERPREDGVDPDIAGIVPGPQPIPE